MTIPSVPRAPGRIPVEQLDKIRNELDHLRILIKLEGVRETAYTMAMLALLARCDHEPR
jgi:hypothetical protein